MVCLTLIRQIFCAEMRAWTIEKGLSLMVEEGTTQTASTNARPPQCQTEKYHSCTSALMGILLWISVE